MLGSSEATHRGASGAELASDFALFRVYPAGHFTQVNATRISIQLVNAAFGGYEVRPHSPEEIGCGHVFDNAHGLSIALL